MDYKKILFSLPHCSCAMKNEIEKNGFSFSDFNIASIIYNWRLPYVEKIGLLKQIAAETSDEVLKLQINQRIDVDNLQLDKFKENTPQCVFVLQYPDHSIHGIYGEFSMACKHISEMKSDFSICKFQVISEKQPPISMQIPVGIRDMESEHQTKLEYHDDTSEKFGEMKFDKDGRLSSFYTCEIDNEQTREVENLDSKRFENAFVPYPVIFDKGESVIVPSQGVSGTVYGSKEDYQHIIDEAKTNGLYDFVDTFIRIDFENGKHTHASPFVIEKVGDSISIDRALEIAEYKTLKQKAMLNQTVVQSDENGNIIYIPAREVFTKLYNEPVPEF